VSPPIAGMSRRSTGLLRIFPHMTCCGRSHIGSGRSDCPRTRLGSSGFSKRRCGKTDKLKRLSGLKRPLTQISTRLRRHSFQHIFSPSEPRPLAPPQVARHTRFLVEHLLRPLPGLSVAAFGGQEFREIEVGL
jgi:hypothetical protein